MRAFPLWLPSPSRLSLYCSHCYCVLPSAAGSSAPIRMMPRANVRSVPNLVAKTERFYTNPDGSMTKLMYVAMFIGVCNGFHWCFCSPLIVAAGPMRRDSVRPSLDVRDARLSAPEARPAARALVPSAAMRRRDDGS